MNLGEERRRSSRWCVNKLSRVCVMFAGEGRNDVPPDGQNGEWGMKMID